MTSRRIRRVARCLCVLVGLVGLSGMALAQTETGSITGRVYDRERGRGLNFARVVVLGTTFDVHAINGATFNIADVPAGTYTLRASFVGCEPEIIADVRVDAGQTTTIDFGLKKCGSSILPTIVVVGGCCGCGRPEQSLVTKALPDDSVSVNTTPDGDRTLELGAVVATPNPSRRSSVIQFEMRSSQDVSVEIHDVRGAAVRTLFRGRLEAGPRSMSWDGRDHSGQRVSSGFYFVRVRSQGVLRYTKILRL